MIPDYAATLRLFPYMREVKAKLEKDPTLMATLTREPVPAKSEEQALTAQKPLVNQWRLERSGYQSTRSNGDSILDHANVFALAIGEWTKVNTPANGDLNFFHVMNKGNGASEQAIAASVGQARNLLSADVQQRLMYRVLKTIQDKKAISLEYMNKTYEPVEE